MRPTLRNLNAPRRLLAGVILAVATIAGCSTAPEQHTNPTAIDVATTSGHVHGITSERGRQFLGIPYAHPPTGEQRWTLPRAVATPDAVVDGTHAGSPCPQSLPVPGDHPAPSEDCLTLNVTTPRQNNSDTRLPVMVWWHGGGYTSGAGSAYDAQRLADRGHVVVVTINYRLGVFGYLGLPGMTGGGDFGLADEIQSLHWVKANASAFGGDPGNVTVFGESAGAMSACAALTSPASKGLLDKAILASGSCMLHWPDGALYPGVPAHTPYTSVADNHATSTAAAEGLGCGGTEMIDCLRKAPVDRLLTVDDQFSDQLTYGTDLLPTDPADALRQGAQQSIPVITGGNHDEQRSFVGGLLAVQPDAVTALTYPQLVTTAFGPRAPEVLSRYPLRDFPSPGIAWSTVTTDAVWSCPTLDGARVMSRRAPTYVYEFADANAPNVNQITTIPQGAAHATDTPYYFDLGGHDLLSSPRQQQIADQLIDYWTTFARTGTPDIPNGPQVTRTAENTTRVLQFGTSATRDVDYSTDHQCDFWL
ncbi:carboxylesterase family protein [Gordonia sp. CPCC 205515]|uniref:carboxylesterase/lipase family protein n=1 Tax=Gordonia sp. CPCC 205515 TaxID=3140791 RepID=UPI003AF333C0